MAEFPIYRPGIDDPREALGRFLAALHDLLDELMQSEINATPEGPFVVALFPGVRDAWRHSRERYGMLFEALERLTPERLAEHDLDGPPLAAKLASIGHYNALFLANPVPRILRRLLEVIDNLLGSFVIATGVGHFVEELKQAIEGIVDDSDGLFQPR